jgi:hypothetical protein
VGGRKRKEKRKTPSLATKKPSHKVLTIRVSILGYCMKCNPIARV